jgi:hypothetical protein
VLNGIAAGESVVTSGQFLLDSESRLREAIEKYRAGSSAGTAESAASSSTAESSRADLVVAAYLKIAASLGAIETRDEPVDPAPLVGAARALAAEADGGAEHALANRVERAAASLGKKTLAEQREAFKEVSDAVITLVEAHPPTRFVTDRLYVMHCPMAPGRWLQREEKLANPYYAKSMKQCGEIVGTIAALDP